MNKPFLFIIIFFLHNSSLFSQTAEEVRHYFETKSWDSVITCGKVVIEQKKDEYDTYMSVGRAYVNKYMYAEAIPYLEKAKTLKDAPSWVNAWSMCDLGISYYVTGNQKLAAENLKECIELNATKNSTKTALKHYWIFGLDPFYSNWAVEQSKNFNFHFQDNSFKRNSYIKSHEEAFDSLTKLFNCRIPHQIDFYVWTNDSDQTAVKMLGLLAFSRPNYSITHTSISHTLAHEMMHHILFYSFPEAKRDALITEGTCVYFDLSRNDNLIKLKSINKTSEINVEECWKHSDRLGDDIVYPLGGELVKRIYEKFGKEKFFAFMNDQSLNNAERVFGKELDEVIARLDADIKL